MLQQLLEYITRHPILVGVTTAVALAALVYEVSRARGGGQSVGPAEAVRLLNQGAVMIDVRPKDQFDAGHVIDARNFPAADLNPAAEALKRLREKVLILCCDNGLGSAGAARTLRAQGYPKVATLRGGLQGWRADNLPLVKTESRAR
jgi:rhodanese-related sulfurtransferase